VKYRENKKNNDMLSILGFGCMRFPNDEALVEKQILYAVENGVNFFDTAYIYKDSEATLGRVLKKLNLREKIKLSTKLPHYFIKKYEDLDKIFYKQLERLQTDYIDYYFMHMLTDVNVWKRLAGLGILKWIDEKKASGQIKNVGFSYHGGKDEFIKLADIYPWEFCMIQYNYLDEHRQAGKSGLSYAASKGIPVFIMEPLRGGRLVNNLPKEIISLFEKAHIKRTPAEWALRWVWNHPEVTCVLSGMNSLEMVGENISVASNVCENEFTQEEHELFEKVKKIMSDKTRVPCTGCNYCMPCPRGVDIPTCLSCYNNIEIEGKFPAIIKYMMQTSFKSKPQIASLCNKCGKCEKHCPQKIEIRKELASTSKALEKFWFKPVSKLVKAFMKI